MLIISYFFYYTIFYITLTVQELVLGGQLWREKRGWAVIDFNKDKMRRFSGSLNTRGMCIFLCGSSFEAGVLTPGFNSQVHFEKRNEWSRGNTTATRVLHDVQWNKRWSVPMCFLHFHWLPMWIPKLLSAPPPLAPNGHFSLPLSLQSRENLFLRISLRTGSFVNDPSLVAGSLQQPSLPRAQPPRCPAQRDPHLLCFSVEV